MGRVAKKGTDVRGAIMSFAYLIGAANAVPAISVRRPFHTPPLTNDAVINGCANPSQDLMYNLGRGWGSAGGNREWAGIRFSGSPAECEWECLSRRPPEHESICLGYWQFVSPSPYAGSCTIFGSGPNYFTGAGYGLTYNRHGKGFAPNA